MRRTTIAILGTTLALLAAGCVVRTVQPNYYPPASPPPSAQPYYPPPPAPLDREPEEMVLFPDIDVYLVPDVSLNIYFTGGRWYLYSNQAWYWGGSPRGPWTWLRSDDVPAPVRRLPPDWRNRSRWKRIPYRVWRDHDHRWDDSYLRPPPVIIDRDPDEIRLIPGRRVYALPRTDADVFFYLDRWYQRVGDHWYWSTALRGPWNYLQPGDLPGTVREVPRDFRDRIRLRPLPYRPWVDKGHRWEDEDDERWEERQRERERDQMEREREKDAWERERERDKYEREREKEAREREREREKYEKEHEKEARERDRDRRDDGRGGPAFRIDRDPDEIWLLPGQRVYVLPRTDADVFYFSGRWYHRDGARWWWGGTVRGPWIALRPEEVPDAIRRQPGGSRPPGDFRRIPYREWERRGYRWDDDDRAPAPPPPPPATRGEQAARPSEVVFLPRLRVFVLPGTGGMVMTEGKWFRRDPAGRWLAASGWRGPWSPIHENQLPGSVRLVPADPSREPGAERMPFDQWERNGYRWPEPEPTPAPSPLPRQFRPGR